MSRRTSVRTEQEGDVPTPSVVLPGEDPAQKLRLVHAFGVYPVALRDAVISLGDDAFLFCAGRHIAICDQVRHRLSFLPRNTHGRVVTSATKSANGKFIAVAERVGAEEGTAQISIFHLPKAEAIADFGTGKAEAKEQALRVLHPKNHKLDIIGLAFTSDTKHLVSLSCMPDSTITYWRWEADKAVSSHDIQLPVTRMHVNPKHGYQLSISGPSYLRLWDYSPNDHQLKEHPSMLPLKQERQMNVIDHCWVLQCFLCCATEDGHVHLFQDTDGQGHHEDIDVRAQITRDEAEGPKAVEREQAKQLQMLMGMSGPGLAGEPPPVRLSSLAPWGRGFVVGGDQGYLGVFKVDAKMQVEPFGTFRMPNEEGTIWQMSAGSEDTHLTILSYKEKEQDNDTSMSKTQRSGFSRSRSAGSKSAANVSVSSALLPEKERMWALSTFPVGQADLAATGQLEVFEPIFPLGTHTGSVLAMDVSKHRRIVATCSSDMQLKVWDYPSRENRNHPHAFTSALSIHVSAYEMPTALSVHPMGFQVAVILEGTLRVYHLANQQVTRTLFDMPLRHPGDVAYSNSGNMLAVAAEHDVMLLDPWRLSLIHMFSGRGGHLSAVKQVLFSEDDQLLLSCAAAPHGAIYAWDLESQTKERVLEHVSKGTSFVRLAHDFRRQLVVAMTRPDGHLRIIDGQGDMKLELAPEAGGPGYTAMCLAAPLGMLLAGTAQGSVCVFHWPMGSAARALVEVSLHAHPVTTLSHSSNARLLFSADEAGTVMACEVGVALKDADRGAVPMTSQQLDSAFMRFRHREDGVAQRKPVREEDRKLLDFQKKLTEASHGMSANTASLDELQLVPKAFLNDCLSQIKELEERMQSQKRESDEAMAQKEQDTNEQLQTIYQERRHEKQIADDKYNTLIKRSQAANTHNAQALDESAAQFEHRTRELQDESERRLSLEVEKQGQLLDELQILRDQHHDEMRQAEARHEAQLAELRGAQEKAIREWRAEHEKVCNLLKSDGLKFEEALQQQEQEYEEQIFEIQEQKRVALQVESEKSITARKDTVSMKQTINMLQGQLKIRRDELGEAVKERDDLRKKLEEAREMFAKVNDQLKEQKRSLAVKDESLRKVREQMKHLESFRFVLYHRLNALEEERDPLEEQVSSLKTSVREMYSEFVREFRQKQKLDQQLNDQSSLTGSLKKECVELRSQLAQLKKDGRRFLQEVEQVLFVETSAELEKWPKRLQAVVEKHQKLSQWAPPAAEAGQDPSDLAPAAAADGASKDTQMLSEMVIQRDLLFRKNQIAMAATNQTKKECAQDFRRLTSENAALIAEMNTLRDEKRSFQRSCKEMEATLMNLKGRGRGTGEAAVGRSGSAPELGAAGGPGTPEGTSQRRAKGASAGNGETPYMRRKVVDQQELYRRQRQKQMNQLPPVAQNAGTSAAQSAAAGQGRGVRFKASLQEKRFAQTLDSVKAGRQQMERQGFNMGKLSDAAQTATGLGPELPLQRVPSPSPSPATEDESELGSFPTGEGIQPP